MWIVYFFLLWRSSSYGVWSEALIEGWLFGILYRCIERENRYAPVDGDHSMALGSSAWHLGIWVVAKRLFKRENTSFLMTHLRRLFFGHVAIK